MSVFTASFMLYGSSEVKIWISDMLPPSSVINTVSAASMPYSDERYAKIVYASDVNFSRVVVSDALDRLKSKSALFERDGKGDSRTTSSISPHTGRMNFFEKSAVGERKFRKNAESMIIIRLL